MALNITIYSNITNRNGTLGQAPVLTPDTVALSVALASASVAIAGPCLLCLIADEDQRIALGKTAGYVAPASTGIKLMALTERFYELAAGTWYINTVAG